MPGRIAVRSGRPDGPRPFSSEWLAADAPPVESPQRAFRLPTWIPNGRTVSTALLVVVSLAAAIAALVGGNRAMVVAPAPSQTLTALAPASVPSDVASMAPTLSVPVATVPAIAVTESGNTLSQAPAPPEFAQAPDLSADLAAPVVRAPADAALLPEYRVVIFYGHPNDPAMG